MVAYDIIRFVVSTIALIFLGFYVGRGQMLRVVIIALLILLLTLVSIKLNGVYMYYDIVLDTNKYEVIIAILYCAFWLGLGYVMSCFTIIREKDIGVKILKIR
jgi:hypothetical protein